VSSDEIYGKKISFCQDGRAFDCGLWWSLTPLQQNFSYIVAVGHASVRI